MQIGIFSKVFERPSLEKRLDAVKSHGLECVQFHMSDAGIAEMPDEIDPALAVKIREELAKRAIAMTSVSGTFNMIDPDVAKREAGLHHLRTIAAACSDLGTSIITLCTGTRDPISMWRRHPDNDLPDAWRDLAATMSKALTIADEYNVTLAFEPEVSNVIDSAQKARRLIDEMQSPRLKVVMDGANIFHKGELPRMREILDEAFDLLSDDIAFAHAKDLDQDGEAGNKAAGHGLLDYGHYLKLLRGIDRPVPLILHGLTEDQVDGCVAFLRDKLAQG